MISLTRLIRISILPVILIGGVIATPGCGKSESSTSSQPAGNVDRYVLRGVVAQLPVPGKPGSQFFIRHEPMKEFRDEKGKVVGMPEMTMSFELDSSVSLDGLAVGDKIQADWTVQWEPRTFSVITGIKKLPADTVLNFAPPATQPMDAMPGMTH